MKTIVLFVLSIVCFGAAAAQESKTSTYTVQGTVIGVTGSLIVSNFFEINPYSGKYQAAPNNEEAKKATHPVLLDGRFFKVENLDLSTSRMITIVDLYSNRGAFRVIDPTKAVGGQIDLGEVKLRKLKMVKGKLEYPDYIDAGSLAKGNVTVAYTPNPSGMHVVGVMPTNKQGTFSAMLPRGNYTFFFDVPDKDKNWRRVKRKVKVKDHDVNYRIPIVLKVKLDDLVDQETELSSVLNRFELNSEDFNKADKNALEKIKDNPGEIVVVYFFAGHCGPCLGEKGIRKYLDLTSKYPMSVVAVHSDSYHMKIPSCPRNPAEMHRFFTEKEPWRLMYEKYKAVKNASPSGVFFDVAIAGIGPKT